jgi:hypothetical protein
MTLRTVVLGAAVGVVLLGSVSTGLRPTDGSAAVEAAQQAPPDRRAILEALARLANLTPRELQAAVADHGGVLPALEARGVGRAAVLEALTSLFAARFEPAIAEGRLTREQAAQLAQQQARRLIRRLNQTTPGRQR